MINCTVVINELRGIWKEMVGAELRALPQNLPGGLTENYEQPVRVEVILTDVLTGHPQVRRFTNGSSLRDHRMQTTHINTKRQLCEGQQSKFCYYVCFRNVNW